MRPYLLALIGCAVLAVPTRAADTRYPEDAALHAVQFLDAEVGYAVGDEGAIWKTINGGKTWELMPSRVRASLRSIHMLTHLVGWVVGREEMPYGKGSAGVVLSTRDGGETWRRILPDTMPGLNHIRFADGETAYLLGDGSEQFPTGVFVLTSTEAGAKWQAAKGLRASSWLGGDFVDGKTGTLAGAWSLLGAVREGNFNHTFLDYRELGGRDLCSVQLRQPKSFAVGQGGLIMRSSDGGSRWGVITGNTRLSQDVLAAWDFHSVCCVGSKVWIVGRPGSAVLRSDDQGATWSAAKTGQALPLNAVHFFDENRGWAVGELGCILASTDGGKTWSVQRRGGQRAAVLCIHARAEDLPADTVAMLSGTHGLLTAAVRIAGPDPRSESFADAAQARRFAAGHRAAGGAASEMLWQFPLPQGFSNADKNDLLAFWNQQHGNRAAQELLRQLVLSIRMWQPDLVLTDHPDIKITGSAASALVAEALHEAFKQAADPKAFPEQLEQLGLQPWRVAKAYGLWDKRDGSHVSVDNSREITNLQATYAEAASAAVGLLTAAPRALPLERHYRMLNAAQAGEVRDLLDGIPFGPVGVCRRELSAPEEISRDVAAAIKSQRQLVMLARNPGALAESSQLLGQLGSVLAKLPEDRGARAASAIASEFVRRGEWDLARDTYLDMVQRYPMHALSIDACRWLIQHNASSEARRRHELGQFLVGPRTPSKGGVEPQFLIDPKAPAGQKPNPILQQGLTLGNRADFMHWHQGSLLLGKHMTGFGAVHADDPVVQFCVQAANRRLGKSTEALEFYAYCCAEYSQGAWRDAAHQELRLVKGIGESPRPVASCRFAGAKPYLDGQLDDACWQGQKPLVLKDAISDPTKKQDAKDAASGNEARPGPQETAKDYPTEAMLSFDEKYLYIALRCQHPPGMGVPPAKDRPRDADLRAFDRVSILLDLDRDYSTYFHLQVDQRGCVCEDCWGDKRWNPQWFVAISSNDTGWQVEAAIPLHELTGEGIPPGTAWACNLVRYIPGRGIQAWSTPAGIEPRPEGMGIMVFQRP